MKTNKIKTIVLALANIGLAGLPVHPVFANPVDGNVVAGSVSIQQESATKLGITQTSNKAIVDWKSFSIGANEHTQIYQPSASSVILNRVVGEDPSQILGRLTANGQVFLVNPNGIFFGRNAQIDVASLVASTHNIRNEDFLAGNYKFNLPGKPGAAVINEGTIRVADTGIAAFIAPSVANRGVVVARLGKVALAAANGFTLDFTGDQLLSFLVGDEIAQTAFDIEGKPLTSFVENSGRIEAQGGYVLLTAKAAENAIHSVINQSGTIEATSVGRQNGEIVLSGGKHGVVSSTGSLNASGKNAGETGGAVQITGEKIGLFAGTQIDVSGDQGGGKVIIGGDYLGGKASDALMAELGIARENHAIQTAAFTNMAREAVIDASAISHGKGGKIVLWSDNATRAYGAISATGGANGGDGGFIEVSGQRRLDIFGIDINAGARKGRGGTVLYDPGDVYITTDALAVASYDVTNFTSSTAIGGRTNIASSNIENVLNNGTNVTIRGNPGTTGNDSFGQVYIQNSIRKTRGGDAQLSLFAADEIILYAGNEITSTSGKLNIYMDADFDRYSYGLIDFRSGSVVRTNGGFMNLNGSDIRRNGVIDTTDAFGSSGQTRTAHDYFQTLNFAFLQSSTPKSELMKLTPIVITPESDVDNSQQGRTGQGTTNTPNGGIPMGVSVIKSYPYPHEHVREILDTGSKVKDAMVASIAGGVGVIENKLADLKASILDIEKELTGINKDIRATEQKLKTKLSKSEKIGLEKELSSLNDRRNFQRALRASIAETKSAFELYRGKALGALDKFGKVADVYEAGSRGLDFVDAIKSGDGILTILTMLSTTGQIAKMVNPATNTPWGSVIVDGMEVAVGAVSTQIDKFLDTVQFDDKFWQERSKIGLDR